MVKRDKLLKPVWAYLMGQYSLNNLTEQLSHLSERDITDLKQILTEVEEMVQWADDPTWLEAIAAQKEGVIIPTLAEFLANEPQLAKFDPLAVTTLQQLLNTVVPDDLDLRPTFPTFGEQLAQSQTSTLKTTPTTLPTAAPFTSSKTDEDITVSTATSLLGWAKGVALGSILTKAGTFLIQPLSGLQTSTQATIFTLKHLTPPLLPKAATVRSNETEKWVTLYTAQFDEADTAVAITIKAEAAQPNLTHARLTITVDIPERGGWPHLKGSEVNLHYKDSLLQTGITNAYGRIIFEDIDSTLLPEVSFEIKPLTSA